MSRILNKSYKYEQSDVHKPSFTTSTLCDIESHASNLYNATQSDNRIDGFYARADCTADMKKESSIRFSNNLEIAKPNLKQLPILREISSDFF